jgi:hypothetical protein
MSGDESMHEWDAAYVLGALSPDDRRRFEAHLEECPECRASVTELAGIPALLARVPAPEIEAASGTPAGSGTAAAAAPAGIAELPATLLPAVAHRVRRRRIVRRWVLGGASVLAAAAIAAAVVLPTTINTPPEGSTVTLAQATPGPLSATVSLTAKRWGTALTMTCRYAAEPSGYSEHGSYALYVTDSAGHATRVASWSAWPGASITASGAVDLPKSQLRSVQIRDTTTDAVLLSSPVR